MPEFRRIKTLKISVKYITKLNDVCTHTSNTTFVHYLGLYLNNTYSHA